MRHGGLPAALLAGLIATGCGGGSAPPPAASGAAAPAASRSSASSTQPADPTTTTATATTAGTAAPPTSATTSAKPDGTPPPAHPIPASFRASGISPGAPSDAEVRAELQQMYAAQKQARKLSADAANFAALLPWVQEKKTGELVSVASVFRDYGLGLACGGVLGVNQIGVAHKTAPCGTLIDFTYNGRTLRVPVIDRGPYIVGREWDLTGATAAALGFPGLGRIIWRCASC